jgi:hypothetical protein
LYVTSTSAVKTNIQIRNTYNRTMPRVPILYGVPIPEGKAATAAHVGLVDEKGKALAVSVEKVAQWPDGSVRWALLDFQLDLAPHQRVNLNLTFEKSKKPAKVTSPVKVTQSKKGIEVKNGPLKATFEAGQFSLFTTLTADGVAIISKDDVCDIVGVSPLGKIHRASYDPKPRLSLEEANEHRAVVRWDGGHFAGDGTRLAEFRVKVTFFAGNPYVKVEHSVVNREMPEAGIHFREYRIELSTRMEKRAVTKTVHQINHGVDYFARLVQLDQNVKIRVPSKGEDANLGHPDAIGSLGTVGKSLIEDEGAFKEDVGSFPHFIKPGAPRVVLGGGYGLVFPYLGVNDGKRTIVASILRMNAQHPKAMTSDENRLTLDLYPPGYPKWRLCRGMTKTHHIALSFFGKKLTAEQIDNEAVRREFFAFNPCNEPVEIVLDPEYVRSTGQAETGDVLPYSPGLYPKLEAKIAGIKLHGDALGHSGIVDYGEAIATNNEEDQGYEYAMEYYRSASYENFAKAVAQMLHNSTIDIVDWDPDKARMGGTPYHTNYHQDSVTVTSHFWTEGMFLYSYMTGDKEAYRAAVGQCEWCLRYMKARPKIVKQDGREIGWPIIALTAGYQATGNKRYLDACYELIELYHEKIRIHGRIANDEPPGSYYLAGAYGEYAGIEGMHKLWRVTKDEKVRTFVVELVTQFIEEGHIKFHSHGRFMDLYALYAVWDMTRDAKWLTLSQKYVKVALARPNWDGYFYRRVMHFLGMCHQHGLINDDLVVLKD